MGKSLKIKFIFIAAIIFMMAGSGFSADGNPPEPEVSCSESLNKAQEVFIDTPRVPGFALHESCFSFVVNGPTPGSVKQWDSFKAVKFASEVAVQLVLANSVSSIIYFPVHIRKVDLLYPFHYFF